MEQVQFPYLKQYSQFLLDNHLDTFTKENIRLAKEMALPANKVIFNWGQDEYYDFIKDRSEIFLRFFLSDEPVERAIEELEKWKTDTMPKVTGRVLNIEDLTGSFTIRRIIIASLLKYYTDDCALYEKIINEFNIFYHEWEKGAFRILFELQNNQLLKEIEISTRELSNKNKELEKINSDLDNFVYTASHDLKAPVTNISGLIRHLNDLLVKKNVIDEELVQVLSMMEKSVKRFQSTISDLTEISKIQKNLDDEVEEIDLVEMIEEVKIVVDDMVKETMAEILFTYSQIHSIKFSKNYLRSIFYNLISNALKYRSPERKPLINISFESLSDYFIVKVSDNGLGMKKDAIPRIFEMFKRFHSHVEGTGVGLYLVKRIIENTGGSIQVESEEGIGSTFILIFKKFSETENINASLQEEYTD